MATNEERDALTACLATIEEFVHDLKEENRSEDGLTAPNLSFTKKLIHYIKSQHMSLSLDVPDSLVPTARRLTSDLQGESGAAAGISGSVTALNPSDGDTDIEADHGLATNTPNLGMVLNMLIHPFNGDSSYPVDTFLKDVSRVCRRRHIRGLGKIEIAMGKLRDPALSTIRAMSLGDVTSWTEFKIQMLELFTDVTDLPTLSLEISKCKQQENESVTNFSVRLYNLLLKKARFSSPTDQTIFRQTIDADAIAMLMIGVRNTEIASVVRRAYPKSFKEAVKIAKLEELATKTSNENTQMFFKQVKMATHDQNQYIPNDYQQNFEQRNNDRNFQRGGGPRYNNNRQNFQSNNGPNNYQNNYQQNNRNPRYRDQTPGERNQQDNRGNRRNSRGDNQDRNTQRGRSREKDNSQQRRRQPTRSQSADNKGDRARNYVIACDCQACEPNFPNDYAFPDIKCYGCNNYGHTKRCCIHLIRGREDPQNGRERGTAPQKINTVSAPAITENVETALVSYPITSKVENETWE
jgi:hypothetical protein